MTTTTSGLTPVATTTELAGAVVETLVRPASQRRPHLALWVVGLDVLVAVTVAGAAAIHPSPGGTARGAIVLGWPVAIAVAGGYSRLAAEPRRFPARALLAAALATATAVWSLPTLIPGAGTDESPRTLAAAALLLAAVVCLGSATARGLIALVAPSHSVPTVLVGPSSQVRELLREAARPGGRRAFEPVAVCLPDPASDDFDPATRGLARAGHVRRVRRPPGRRAHPPRRGGGRRPRAGRSPTPTCAAGARGSRTAASTSWSAPGLRDVARGRLAFTTLGGAGPGPRAAGAAVRRGPAGQGRRGPGRGGRAAGAVQPRSSAC